MSERVWHKGPPPHVGWWETSTARIAGAWRWWDGSRWSFNCGHDEPPGEIAQWANLPSADSSRIEWTDYWPENARVPRLDPTGGHWTFNTDDKPPPYTGVIDVAFRGGHIAKAVPQFGWLGFDWNRDGLPADILAWRPAA